MTQPRLRKPPEWVAGLCDICNDVVGCRLGTMSGEMYEECEQCGHRTIVDPDSFLTISPTRPDSLRELIHRTRPRLPGWSSDWVAKRRAGLSAEADPVLRAEWLRVPFRQSQYLAPGKFLEGRTTIGITLYFLATLIIAPFGGCFALTGFSLVFLNKRNSPHISSDAIMILSLGIGLIMLAVGYGIKRWRDIVTARRAILAQLARALRPQRPSEEELADIRRWLIASANPLAKHVDMSKLAAAIKLLPDTSFRNIDECRYKEWSRDRQDFDPDRENKETDEDPARYDDDE